jgi:hypothetical protein
MPAWTPIPMSGGSPPIAIPRANLPPMLVGVALGDRDVTQRSRRKIVKSQGGTR